MPIFPLGRVSGAAALGGLEIPQVFQQFQVILLASHQDRPSKVRDVTRHLVLGGHLGQLLLCDVIKH